MGSIDVTVTGGAAPYAYQWARQNTNGSWSNIATTQDINNASVGFYRLRVYNSAVCGGSQYFYFAVQQGTSLGLSFQVTDNICGQSIGEIQTTAINANGSINYLWSNGATSASLTGLADGNYTVTATDGVCSVTESVVVNKIIPSPSFTINHTDASCGLANGAADLTMTNGVAPYTFIWQKYSSVGGYSNIASTEDISNLETGTYRVLVYNNNQCPALNLDYVDIGGERLTLYKTNENCNQQDGSITINASGFAGTPTYQWSNGATTPTISGLGVGLYTVTVSDGNCTLIDTASIQQVACIHIQGRVVDHTATGNCVNGYGLSGRQVRLMPGNIVAVTDGLGYYRFNVYTANTYTLELITTGANFVLDCPVGNSITVNTTGSGFYGGNDFFLSTTLATEVSVINYHYGSVRQGLEYYEHVRIKNNGNTAQNGVVSHTFSTILNYLTANSSNGINFNNINGNVLTFDYSNLLPGETRYITLTFFVSVNATIGTTHNNCVNITPLAGDAIPTNNQDCESITIMGPCDPNIKTVMPFRTGDEINGGGIYLDDEIMQYTIRFQNIGTASAINVVLRDTLDALLLPETIEEIAASHHYQFYIENGNQIRVLFEGINLPDSTSDPEGSIGYLSFQIRRQSGLPIGTSFGNRAGIYFDYNDPIITNTVVSTIIDPTSVIYTEDLVSNIKVLPNPFSDYFNLQYDLNGDTEVAVYLYNALGENVSVVQASKKMASGNHQIQINSMDLPSGVYLLQIHTDKGVLSQKLVKE